MIDYVKNNNSKQKQHTRNTGRKKETKPEQETKGGAEESTETRRVPQRRVPDQISAEAEREGEADKKEVRAGPRGQRRAEVVDD